jgi:hypothetical protein
MINIIVILVLLSIIGFLIFKLRSKRSYDGDIFVTVNENGGKLFTLSLNGDPQNLI